MSRIGRLPIPVPAGVELSIEAQRIRVKGTRGELSRALPLGITVEREGAELVVKRPSNAKPHRALHGLTRALIHNMVLGVSQGFERTLELQGVGYRAQKTAAGVSLQVGFSHPVEVTPLPGVTVDVEGNRVIVRGISKENVGETAARIRRVRPPEPYKGKGIRYSGEVVRRKAGKAGKIGAGR